jgi:hypothetical protein
VYFKIDIDGAGGDVSNTIEVNESDWENRMNLRPVRYYFWPDSSYNILQYDLRDSLVNNVAGRWSVFADTLVMQDTLPKTGNKYHYETVITGRMLELRGIEDSDNDGKKDDLYYGTFRKFKPKG